jgi:hypothetical protein
VAEQLESDAPIHLPIQQLHLGERTPVLWLAVYDGHSVRRASLHLTARQAGDSAALLSGGIRSAAGHGPAAAR